MSPSSRRLSGVARVVFAATLALVVAIAPIPAFAQVDQGLGDPVEVMGQVAQGADQIVTAGGWYDASDYSSATPMLTLKNVDTGESVDLPDGAQNVVFTDSWAAWSEGDAGTVGYRDMRTGQVGSLAVAMPDDARIVGDRLIGTTAAGDGSGAGVVAYSLPSGAVSSTPYVASDSGTGLVASGDWVAWSEPASSTALSDGTDGSVDGSTVGTDGVTDGSSDATGVTDTVADASGDTATGQGDSTGDGSDQGASVCDIKAWNVATGKLVTVAEGVLGGTDQGPLDLRLDSGHLAWIDDGGLHVFSLDAEQDVVVAPTADEFALTNGWVAWTAAGTGHLDDVYARDLASSGDVQRLTSTAVDEWGLEASNGWVVFQTPDALGNPGVVTGIDLGSRSVVQVSDPTDPSSSIEGVDGGRVSWVTSAGTSESSSSSDEGDGLLTLHTRVLGLPGPALPVRSYGDRGTATVSWPSVADADGYEYTIGDGEVQTVSGTSLALTGLANGAPVSVRVRAIHGDIRSPWSETMAVVAAPSKLTVSTRSTTVSHGARISFAVKLTSGSAKLTGAKVHLECSADAVVWSAVPGSETTVKKGVATLKATGVRTLRYRAVFAGDNSHALARSSVLTVAARASVSEPSVSGTAKKGSSLTFSGALLPDHVVHSASSVTIYGYHQEGRRWVQRSKTKAATTFDKATSTSAYVAQVKLSKSGKWRFQAVYAGSSLAAEGASSYRILTVK